MDDVVVIAKKRGEVFVIFDFVDGAGLGKLARFLDVGVKVIGGYLPVKPGFVA